MAHTALNLYFYLSNNDYLIRSKEELKNIPFPIEVVFFSSDTQMESFLTADNIFEGMVIIRSESTIRDMKIVSQLREKVNCSRLLIVTGYKGKDQKIIDKFFEIGVNVIVVSTDEELSFSDRFQKLINYGWKMKINHDLPTNVILKI